MKEILKKYFKGILENKSENIEYGNTLTFGVQYLDEKGEPLTEMIEICKVNKEEL